MASESPTDQGNVPRTGARGTISSGGVAEKPTGSGPRGYISRGVIAQRKPNDGENLSRAVSPGETSSSDDSDEQDQQQRGGGVHDGTRGGGSEVYKKEQEEIKHEAFIIGKTLTRVLTNVEPVLKTWTIYKVPENWKDAYGGTSFEPKHFCFGPFYYYNHKYKDLDIHKWRFFSRFLNSMNTSSSTTAAPTSTAPAAAESSSTAVDTNNKKIECIIAALKKIEASTKASYSQNVNLLSSGTIAQMMMVDGCFIIELLRLCEKLGKENVDDPLFSSSTIPNLRHDLLILENQLPFPVLETLFEMSSSPGNVDQPQHSLKYLILKFLNPLLPREKKVLDHVLTVVKDKKPHHLLDFFRSTFLMERDANSTHINVSPSTSDDDQDRLVLIHCVTELREAGIEFKKRENHNLLDIEFKNGKLYIPPLLIDDNTKSVFLNFLVYEQSNKFLEPYFANYLLFLDSLVDSSTDIEHLHYKGIIDHVLSSNEQVAELFNKLCKDVVHDLADNYLSNVLKDVNRYTGRRWNRWRAAWKHTYFKNPWAFSSFLAAVFLLILTTIQTFFSVYAYVAPPS